MWVTDDPQNHFTVLKWTQVKPPVQSTWFSVGNLEKEKLAHMHAMGGLMALFVVYSWIPVGPRDPLFVILESFMVQP